MKLSVGTAQLGMRYGICGKKISSKEFVKIKRLILKNNIQFIDTASAYGKSEKIIGDSVLNKLNIITKFTLPKIKKKEIKNWLIIKIDQTLKILNSKKIYGVLIHSYKDLKGQKGKEYLKELLILKKKKKIKKLGISIYETKELKYIWKYWKPDIVQAPLNILDTRLISSGWLSKLKKAKVQVQVRSIFLQGLLIKDRSKFLSNKNKIVINKFYKWCKNIKISRKLACLHFVKQFCNIDHIVIGVDNASQLKEIIYILKKKLFKIPNKFSTKDLKLIDPRKWTK